MKLFYTHNSPFARVARVFLREKGLRDRVEEVLAKLRGPENVILRHGPAGKAPALLTGAGRLLTETPVICAYLDTLVPARPPWSIRAERVRASTPKCATRSPSPAP